MNQQEKSTPYSTKGKEGYLERPQMSAHLPRNKQKISSVLEATFHKKRHWHLMCLLLLLTSISPLISCSQAQSTQKTPTSVSSLPIDKPATQNASTSVSSTSTYKDG